MRLMDNAVPRQQLKEALDHYLSQQWKIDHPEDRERMFAGILALIAVEALQQPYLPINITSYEEDKKKWYQFWK